MRRPSALVIGLAIALFAALPVAFAGSSADPGISSTAILIGGTSPLTGPAASYATVARGAQAYFDSINAKGGVAKRKIEYRIADDAYNPAQTVQAVLRLVEQDSEVTSDQLLLAVSEHRLRRGVERFDDSLAVHRHDAAERILDDRSDARLRRA